MTPMPRLNIEPNLASPDEFYASLVNAHRDLTPAQSQRLNARLILLLANHVGDDALLRDALDRARAGVDDASAETIPAVASAFPPLEEGNR